MKHNELEARVAILEAEIALLKLRLDNKPGGITVGTPPTWPYHDVWRVTLPYQVTCSTSAPSSTYTGTAK